MAKFLCDNHIHTKHSYDAPQDGGAELDAICRSAVERGLSSITITDHFDFADELYIEKTDFDVDAAYADFLECRARYNGTLDINFGVELGEPLENLKTAQSLIDKYPFDFILGSLHNLHGVPDFYFLKMELLPMYMIDKYMDCYFEQVISTLDTDFLSAFAHLTYINRYMMLVNINYDYSRCADIIDTIFKKLIIKGMALELNISTLQKSLRDPMPSYDMVRRYRELGGELITVGTDSHEAKNVGIGIGAAYDILSDIGFNYVTTFKDRKPVMKKI